MKRMAVFACVLAAVALMAGCGSTKKGKVLVEVNGENVTEGDIEFLGTINPRIQAQIMNPDGKKRILDNIVEQELLYQKALKEGINRKSDVKAKIDLYRRVIIAQSLVDDEIEKAAKKYYDEHADEFKKLKFSHILVKYANPEDAKKAADKKAAVRGETDALKLANEIKARLDKGEDFATVAKEASEDTMTKNRGGDLGLAAKGEKRFDARGMGPLVDKAFEMKVGEISGPIKTNAGYEIITVTQGAEVEPFDEAKNAIIFKVRNDVRNQFLADLKKDATIKYPGEEKAAAEKKETPAPGGQPAAAEGQPAVLSPEVGAEKPGAATTAGKTEPVQKPEENAAKIQKMAKETMKKMNENRPAPKKAPQPQAKP